MIYINPNCQIARLFGIIEICSDELLTKVEQTPFGLQSVSQVPKQAGFFCRVTR